jgi:hypothetical protein
VPAVQAQPVLGARQEFAVPGVGGWVGGTPSINPLSGGRLGAADGYMQLVSAFAGNFGQGCRCAEYTGDWTAAGITQMRLWLNDVGVDDFFEIHVVLGNDSQNYWQYDIGFTPPENEWAEFVVDLTDVANWTQTIGAGSFASAISAVGNVLIRHDLPPFVQQPDATLGDLGIDSILLTNGIVGIGPSPAASAIRLAAPYPNPARGPVTFALEAPGTELIRLQILDVTGRSIRTTELAGGASGPRTWMWDGLDDDGRQVAPGAYRVRAIGATGAISRPFSRIR